MTNQHELILRFRSAADLAMFADRVRVSDSVTVSSYTENEIPVLIVEGTPVMRRQLEVEYCCPVGICAFRGTQNEVHIHIVREHGYPYFRRRVGSEPDDSQT